MAVRPPGTSSVAASASAAATTGAESPLGWQRESRAELDGRPAEGRAERWATWVVIYLAALVSSLAVGASAWALGLVG
ncbi:MAG: hypothetical protein IT306_29400 [Chloroflexi bacterium]|nr:hypothetical protein [Chloroflexota bacterium]